MRKRRRMSRGRSRKLFRKTASRFHKKNLMGGSHVMRGGIRL